MDEVEYALPASEAPTLAEVLSTEEEEFKNKDNKNVEEPPTCSALQVDFLQGVSQQLLQAQVRIIKLIYVKREMEKYGKLAYYITDIIFL